MPITMRAEQMSQTTSADWAEVRSRMMLDPTVVNLNTGSGGPLSRTVFDRVTDLRRELAAEPMDFLLRKVPSMLWQARERLSDFIGGDPRQLAFTTNVTGAVNLVASSLPLSAPGEILLTDYEYVPMRWCWERVAQRLGLRIRTFAVPVDAEDPAEIVQAAAAAMGPDTRLFFFSHVLSSIGLVMPAAQLCELARGRGVLTMIDGAHAPGFLDLDVTELGCDFYAGSGHKWLLAPTGNGFLYSGRGNLELLEPLQVSWAYVPPPGSPPDERDRFGSTPRLRRLECEGTRDICPWLALPESIDFHSEIGFEQIRSRTRELTEYTRERLTGLRSITPRRPELSGAMTSFALPSKAKALSSQLWEQFRIEASVVERPDQQLIRVSTNFYNTEAEIDRLAEALDKLVQN
jgi:isopenicillin-N epimerase